MSNGREEFAAAVSSTISSIHHLYREVDRLIIELRSALSEEPNPLKFLAGTFSKGGRDLSRLTIRNEYGALFVAALSDDDVADEDDDEIDEEEAADIEDEEVAPKKSSRTPEIVANVPALAVRIAMYEPQKRAQFEPQIQYGIMNEWTIGKKPFDADQRFILRRYMLRRVPRTLGSSTNLAAGARLTTKASVKTAIGVKKMDDRQLGCRLPVGVETVPLYTLDTAEALDRLVIRMKAMWSEVSKAG